MATKFFIFSSLKTKNYLNLVRKNHSNVVIIGGGAMGASTAYWLMEKANKKVTVTVIEKDPSYVDCTTARSVGGIRQQFSSPENIQMSLFGADFIKTLKQNFGAESDISYKPNGYLVLASNSGAPNLEQNFQIQKELGVSNVLLTGKELKEKFNWLNCEDVALGCLGGPKEGWFDPWRLLSVFKEAAQKKGARFIKNEVVGFIYEKGEVRGVQVKDQEIYFDSCVVAAGAESGSVAKLAKIGEGEGVLSIPLPVERRKRYVYRFDSQGENPPGPNSPLTIDFTGAYFRMDGNAYIGGASPRVEDEPSCDNLDVDFQYFDNYLWPLLAHRFPAFGSLKIRSAWSGFYEYNTIDKNGIIGPHPFYKNLFFVTGFSGHGIQQSPAAGLAVAELILDGKFKTIDLNRMGFDRFVSNKPLIEISVF